LSFFLKVVVLLWGKELVGGLFFGFLKPIFLKINKKKKKKC